MDIEALPAEKKAVVEIDPFIGINAFEITNALTDTGCPEPFISALVQHLPKLWELYDGYGLTTKFAHCSKVAAQTGQTVKRNQVIAYVGNTGLATGPHLHFELWSDGTPLNPKDYISF